jgi:hypothetical protein
MVGTERESVGPLFSRHLIQPERDVNREGRKRAEKGQKMADGTNGVRELLCDIRMLGWLGNLDSNQD